LSDLYDNICVGGYLTIIRRRRGDYREEYSQRRSQGEYSLTISQSPSLRLVNGKAQQLNGLKMIFFTWDLSQLSASENYLTGAQHMVCLHQILYLIKALRPIKIDHYIHITWSTDFEDVNKHGNWLQLTCI
jgi:hypothetical protein